MAEFHVTPESVVVRKEAMLASMVDDEAVALDADRGSCYALNPVATRIWQLIETPCRVSAIAAALCEEYEVDAADCQRHVLAFLNDLAAEGVVIEAGMQA